MEGYRESILELCNVNNKALFISEGLYLPNSCHTILNNEDVTFNFHSFMSNMKNEFNNIKLINQESSKNAIENIEEAPESNYYSFEITPKSTAIISFKFMKVCRVKENVDKNTNWSKHLLTDSLAKPYFIGVNYIEIIYPSLITDEEKYKMLGKFSKITNNSLFEDHSKEPLVYFMRQRGQDYTLEKVEKDRLRQPNVDIPLDLLYGKNGQTDYDRFISALSSDDKGICILSGETGTGKTSFIRRAIREVELQDKYFTFVDIQNLTKLSIDVIMQLISSKNKQLKDKNCVVVIEDADVVLESRELNTANKDLISSILNASDGIMNDFYKTQFVFTSNLKEHNLDDAMRRENRMIYHKVFKKLTKDEADKLYNHFDRVNPTDKDQALTDIFIQVEDKESNHYTTENKSRIGIV